MIQPPERRLTTADLVELRDSLDRVYQRQARWLASAERRTEAEWLQIGFRLDENQPEVSQDTVTRARANYALDARAYFDPMTGISDCALGRDSEIVATRDPVSNEFQWIYPTGDPAHPVTYTPGPWAADFPPPCESGMENDVAEATAESISYQCEPETVEKKPKKSWDDWLDGVNELLEECRKDGL